MKTFDDRKKCVLEKMRRNRRKKLTAVTCVLTAMAVLAMVLFIPFDKTPPSIRKYKDNAYYGLIDKLNNATYYAPEEDNVFQVLTGWLDSFVAKNVDVKGEMWENVDFNAQPGAAMDETSGSTYVEVTDNQVSGVIESDIFKRSSEYLFYLRGTELRVFTIQQKATVLAGSYQIELYPQQESTGDVEETKPMSYISSAEMYLSQDCSTVTVLLQTYDNDLGTNTVVLNLDVTDPANISEIGRVTICGAHNTSRLVDGQLLVLSRYALRASAIDFADVTTFVPWVSVGEATYFVEPENIQSPESLTQLRYTVVCALDAKTLEYRDAAAFLSYTEDVYVSEDTIYATRSYTETSEPDADGFFRQVTMTEISAIGYGADGLEIRGSICLEGTVKNQYSMDQKDGILRVVTSTNSSTRKEKRDGSLHWVTVTETGRSASLYCVDISTWSVVAAVENFAPNGEQAESVRFDGDQAYVCTAVVVTMTDPVFFFDLSDLQNITYTDTGTIDGYSTSLIQLGDGYLLGIGYDEFQQLKVEVYQELDGKVVSVCDYISDVAFSLEYKSYYIDRENNLFGFGTDSYSDNSPQYILLHFDGYSLNVLTEVAYSGHVDNVRATIIDGWLYVLCENVSVTQVW